MIQTSTNTHTSYSYKLNLLIIINNRLNVYVRDLCMTTTFRNDDILKFKFSPVDDSHNTAIASNFTLVGSKYTIMKLKINIAKLIL